LDTKSITLIAVFAAIAVILNTIRIPTIYFPNFFYVLYDIPVIVSFIIYGFKVGFLVETIHIMGQEIFFPMGMGGVVTYPFGLVIHTFMFSGIYFAYKVSKKSNNKDSFRGKRKGIIYSTGFALALRGGLMPFIDYFVLYTLLLPLALSVVIPQSYILALVPAFIVYNVTSTLYAVPIAYAIATKTSNYLRVKAKYLPN
jgi:riboflavin transporter FmnP